MTELRITIFFMMHFLISISQAVAADEWHEIRRGERFQVYSGPESPTGIRSYKAIALITGTIREAATVLVDVGRYEFIFPFVEQSEILRHEENCITASLVFVPPMIGKRLLIAENCVDEGSGTSLAVIMKKIHQESQAADVHQAKVRMFHGSWSVIELPGDTLRVTYILKADPSGHVPVLLINRGNQQIVLDSIWSLYYEILRRRPNIRIPEEHE